MKKYQIWAWIVLGIFLLGSFALIIAFLTSNNPLGVSGLIFVVLGMVGTYFLKRDRDNRNAQEREIKQERKDIQEGRKASVWDPNTYNIDESPEGDLNEDNEKKKSLES